MFLTGRDLPQGRMKYPPPNRNEVKNDFYYKDKLAGGAIYIGFEIIRTV
jgi:hypothetical protein